MSHRFFIRKAFNCIAVNQTCKCIYVGSLEITYTYPLLYNVDDLLFRKEPQIERKAVNHVSNECLGFFSKIIPCVG